MEIIYAPAKHPLQLLELLRHIGVEKWGVIGADSDLHPCVPQLGDRVLFQARIDAKGNIGARVYLQYKSRFGKVIDQLRVLNRMDPMANPLNA